MTEPLRGRLQRYTTPEEYPRLFKANLAAVAEVDSDPAVRDLLSALARVSGIDPELVALDFKRYLLYTDEYYPDLLKLGPLYLARGVAAMGFLALRDMRGRGADEPADVIVDEWMETAQSAFYGDELLARLRERFRVATVDVSDYLHIDLRDLLRALPSMPRLFRLMLRARRALGLEVAHYVYDFVKSALSGKGLARRFGARLVVSGNDAGLPLATTKAAGLKVALIQNGVRGWVADAVFTYADLYLSLEAGVLLPIRYETGSRFERAEPVGSIMLSHYLARRGDDRPSPRHDVVFISSLETERPFDKMFKHYAMEYERRAIALLNELAESGGMSVAYYPRYTNEVEALRGLGLHSDAVTYLEWRPGGVYEAVDAARMVVTSFSTVGLEAMAMGKPVGYVNVSGNELLNPGIPEQGLEWSGTDGRGLAEFLRGLDARDVDLSRYIVQARDYAESAVELIAEAVPR